MIEGTPVAFTSGPRDGLGVIEDTATIGARGAYEIRVTESAHYAPGTLVLVLKTEVRTA